MFNRIISHEFDSNYMSTNTRINTHKNDLVGEIFFSETLVHFEEKPIYTKIPKAIFAKNFVRRMWENNCVQLVTCVKYAKIYMLKLIRTIEQNCNDNKQNHLNVPNILKVD